MEFSMMTRLAWSAFSDNCLNAAHELFKVADSTAFKEKTKHNYQTVLSAIPEEDMTSSKLVSVLCASALLSLEKQPEKEDLDRFYNKAFGVARSCPKGVSEMVSQFSIN